MKYEIGDFVSKPVTGICKIENILYLNPQDEKNDKLYYLMKPVEGKYILFASVQEYFEFMED